MLVKTETVLPVAIPFINSGFFRCSTFLWAAFMLKKKSFNFLCFSKYLFNIANLSQFRSTAFYQAVSSKHMYHLFFTHSHIASNYHRCISLQMQLRFDGTFGFPGGLMHRGEDVVTGLNREVSEEIGWDSTAHPITLKDYFSTQVIMLHHTTTILQLR